jgi:hypothetical protein
MKAENNSSSSEAALPNSSVDHAHTANSMSTAPAIDAAAALSAQLG